MTAPKRIQRRRTKGWRMPDGATYVGRGTRYGNPYRARKHRQRGCEGWKVEKLVAGPSDTYWSQLGCWPDFARDYDPRNRAFNEAIRLYLRDIDAGRGPTAAEIVALRGYDLACWCPLDMPCHADVLLDLANREAVA